MGHFKTRLKEIKAFAFDVDGVFATNQVYLHPSGDMMRSMNIKDGFAVYKATQLGIPIAIISGGASESVRTRFEGLGLTDIYLKTMDKLDAFADFYFKYGLKPEEILYMGDDLPDYQSMKKAGLACCPADAAPEIVEISDYVSDRKGGDGCVRDVIEQVLRSQGKWTLPEK